VNVCYLENLWRRYGISHMVGSGIVVVGNADGSS